MPSNITQYDLLISCPGDITKELSSIKKVVEKFNKMYASVLGLRVNTKHWSKDSFPESGGKPQALLNKQFVLECDAAVAMFWTRFGTPTDEYGSGTEEEISKMLDSKKQVFMYFSEMPLPPSVMIKQNAEYQRVQAFKNKYKDKGIYWTYSSTKEFEELFLGHLSQYFLTLKKMQELTEKSQPKLCLKTLNGLNSFDYLELLPFQPKEPEIIFSEITELFERIKKYNIFDSNKTRVPFHIAKDTQEFIKTFAEQYNIKLPSNFFALGSLYEKVRSTFHIADGISTLEDRLEGTSQEKIKYSDINNLEKNILSYMCFTDFSDLYKDYLTLSFCAQNMGTEVDEDIEISIYFPKDKIILPEDLPIHEEDVILQTVIEETSLKSLLTIKETSKNKNFASSKNNRPSPNFQRMTLPFVKRDYRKEFEQDLLNTYNDYEFFEEQNMIILKLTIDYLKHNTTVAFPTVLFVTKDLQEVSYSISSRHCESPINGSLKVK